MATSQANLMQTAVNAATTITAAFVQAGLVTSIEEAGTVWETERVKVFDLLGSVPNDAPSTGGGYRKSGGGTSSGGRGKTFTAEEARAIDLAFGRFKGVTLGELENMTGSDCAEYGYGDGEKTGIQYLKYLANNDDPKGSFIKRAATAVLEDRRSQAA